MIHLPFAAFLLLLPAGPAAGPGLTLDHVIILTGSQDQKETEKRLADLMKRWPDRVELRAGYPKVVNSGTVKGLKPGYVIALAGACATREDAVEVQRELRKTIPGVYVRAVTRYLPGFIPKCPRLGIAPKTPRAKPKVPKRYALADQGPATKDGLQWKIYIAKRQCGEDVLVRLLDARGALVDERSEKAHCVRGDPAMDGSGESKVWRAYLQKDTGGPSAYVMLTYELWANDTGCNGGAALCPTLDGIVEEELDGLCSSSAYTSQEGETHCRGMGISNTVSAPSTDR